MQVSKRRYKIHINGIVQGVGFRPHVFRLAAELGLKGWVLNSSSGVFIEAEGTKELLDNFLTELLSSPPPLADIRQYQVEETSPCGYDSFTIKASENDNARSVMISPDIATCQQCKREINDRGDRRYRYPFTNCTNCGPRFTIIKDVPYDRAKTTMASFPMCQECQQEYENPLNRRFHAQPNACPVCGPHITLVNANQEIITESVTTLLKKGYIIAVKGLGGFHLAVDATNREAVSRLRRRKKRDAKPFAVMTADLATAQKYCKISPVEEKYLLSKEAPIVVLNVKDDNGLPADAIHPGLNTLGVMLPYTPLHFLLFTDEIKVLVMTSANISDEPLIIDNHEALVQLKEVADYFLLHNRDIYNPCDDSVISITALNTTHFFRRARGYVPTAIPLPASSRPVLAVGSEMKNTFCLTRGTEAYLSQHWGDLNHYHNYLNFLNGIERFQNMLDVKPEVIVYDLHPEYQATRWAKKQTGVKLIGVQHHHAHMVSVMAEHALQGEVLGLICDGTGWGTDGTIWGGEILKGDCRNFERLGHLKYLPLVGGDLSSKRPYRMALIYLYSALGSQGIEAAGRLLPNLSITERDLILRRIESQSEIMTSSCGRLFDAVGALLGISPINNYEGQSAIELEALAAKGNYTAYDFLISEENKMFIMDILPAWAYMLKDIENKVASAIIARKFHNTVINMFTATLLKLRSKTGLNRLVLSGGVFHNQILLLGLIRTLRNHKFEVYFHEKLPPGDGGISLGQAVIGIERGKDHVFGRTCQSS